MIPSMNSSSVGTSEPYHRTICRDPVYSGFMPFSGTSVSLIPGHPGGFRYAGLGVAGWSVIVFGLLPHTLPAQAVEVDQGTFIVELGGRVVGTETFRIRRLGFGDNARTIAEGTLEIVLDGSRQTVHSLLGAVGVGMSLDAYQVNVSLPSELSIRLDRRGGRMVSSSSSEAGVEEREYRRALPQNPTVVLDRFFAHHYFFLAPYQSPGGISLSAIRPRRGSQSTGTLRMTTVEPVTVGDATIQAQRLELRIDGAVHEIWLDVQNRVLRVQIPSQGYVAVRRDPPPN